MQFFLSSENQNSSKTLFQFSDRLVLPPHSPTSLLSSSLETRHRRTGGSSIRGGGKVVDGDASRDGANEEEADG